MQNIGPLLPVVSKTWPALSVAATDTGDAFTSILGQAITAPLPAPTPDAPLPVADNVPVAVDDFGDPEAAALELSTDQSPTPADFGLPPAWPQLAVPAQAQASQSPGFVQTARETSDASGLAAPQSVDASVDARVALPLIASAVPVPAIFHDSTQVVSKAENMPKDDIAPRAVVAPHGPTLAMPDRVAASGLPLPAPNHTDHQVPVGPAGVQATLLHAKAPGAPQPTVAAAQSVPAVPTVATTPPAGLRVAQAALRQIVEPVDARSARLQPPTGMTIQIIAQPSRPAPLAAPIPVVDGEPPLDVPRDAVPEGRAEHVPSPDAKDNAPATSLATPAIALDTMATFADGSLPDIAAGEASPNTLLPAMGSSVSVTAPTAAAIPMAALPQVVAQALREDPARQVELRLDPPELGSVRFQLDQRSSDLVVTIIAERPETLDLMRRHSEQLLADLRQAGFAGASLHFGTSQGQGGSGQQGFAHGTGQNSGQNAPATPAPQQAFSTPPPPKAAKGGLNLRL